MYDSTKQDSVANKDILILIRNQWKIDKLHKRRFRSIVWVQHDEKD